jgi:hypothetical protein
MCDHILVGRHTAPYRAVRRLHLAGPIARVPLEAENGGHVQVHLSLERFYELALQPGVAAFVVPKNGRVFEVANKTVLG